MKKYYFLFLFLLQTITIQSQIEGAHFFTMECRGTIYDIVKIDLRKTKVKMALANDKNEKYRSIEKLKNEIETRGAKLIFAMNGGMYLKDGTPQGLYMEDGKTITKLDKKENAYGNFYLQPNGVFAIFEDGAVVETTKQFQKENTVPVYATQSGPMLLFDNNIHPKFNEGSPNTHIRNGVGQISEHELVFAISKQKVNLFDFAMLFHEGFGCDNALYLDGFVSKAWMPPLNRLDLKGNFGVIIYVGD